MSYKRWLERQGNGCLLTKHYTQKKIGTDCKLTGVVSIWKCVNIKENCLSGCIKKMKRKYNLVLKKATKDHVLKKFKKHAFTIKTNGWKNGSLWKIP